MTGATFISDDLVMSGTEATIVNSSIEVFPISNAVVTLFGSGRLSFPDEA